MALAAFSFPRIKEEYQNCLRLSCPPPTASHPLTPPTPPQQPPLDCSVLSLVRGCLGELASMLSVFGKKWYHFCRENQFFFLFYNRSLYWRSGLECITEYNKPFLNCHVLRVSPFQNAQVLNITQHHLSFFSLNISF